MKTHFSWFIGVISTCILCQVDAQEIKVNEQKLREALRLPQVQITLAVNFTKADEVEVIGDPDGYARKIAELKKQLDGSPSDASLWFQVGELHEQAEQKKEANKAYSQAAAILQKQIAKDASSPKLERARSRALLGKVIREWSKGDDADAEKWLREAVKLAPDDWSVWKDLGRFLATQFNRYAYTDEQRKAIKKMPGTYSAEEMTRMLPVPSPEGIAKAKRLFAESRKSSDHAIALAPQRSEPYFARFAARAATAMAEVMLDSLQKQKANDALVEAVFVELRQPDSRKDLHHASRYGVTALEIGLPALNEWAFAGMTASREGEESNPLNPAKAWRTYPQETRKTVEQAIDRLQRIAATDAAQKPMALALQGLLEMGTGRQTETVVTLRAALQERPNSVNLREILIGMAVDAKDFDQVESLLSEIPEKLMTTRYYVMRAKIYQQKNDLQGQAEEIAKALNSDPKSPLALLAAATIALKSGGEQSRVEAIKYMESAKKLLADDDDLMYDYQRLTAVHNLLHGKKIDGYIMLRAMARSDENDPQFKELLAAIENF